MRFDSLARSSLSTVMLGILLVGCQSSGVRFSNSSVIAPEATAPIASIQASAAPTRSAALTDPTQLISCRQVPEGVCFEYAISMMRGPQPEYAEGAGIERVIVTCERLPPCGGDRPDSGGKIMILYSNGWAWTQDWAVMSGL